MSSKPFSTLTHHKSLYPSINPAQNINSNAGKSILITGGATGVGVSIASALCISGARRVILSSRNTDRLAQTQTELQNRFRTTQIDILPVTLDDPQTITSFWDKISGQVDVMILSAAHSPQRGPSAEIGLVDATQAMQSNIIGNWILATEYLSHCKSHSIRGTIVDISSAAAHSRNGRNSVYGASKVGGTFLLGALVSENQEHLRIFHLHPGTVWSPMAEKAGYRREDIPCDDDDLVGAFCNWLIAGDKNWLEGRFVWANWDADELCQRKEELEQDKTLLSIGLIGWK